MVIDCRRCSLFLLDLLIARQVCSLWFLLSFIDVYWFSVICPGGRILSLLFAFIDLHRFSMMVIDVHRFSLISMGVRARKFARLKHPVAWESWALSKYVDGIWGMGCEMVGARA